MLSGLSTSGDLGLIRLTPFQRQNSRLVPGLMLRGSIRSHTIHIESYLGWHV